MTSWQVVLSGPNKMQCGDRTQLSPDCIKQPSVLQPDCEIGANRRGPVGKKPPVAGRSGDRSVALVPGQHVESRACISCDLPA